MAYSHLLNSLFKHPDDTLYAAVEGHLKSGQDPNTESPYGETPLKQAYRRGRMDVFELLLDYDADLSAMCWGPLHRAVALGDIRELQTAAKGGDMSARDVEGMTPFLLACDMGDIEKAAFLLPLSNKEDRYKSHQRQPALAAAARKGRTGIVRWLLDDGFEVDETDEFGGTALIAAAEMDKTEIVGILLAAGADINARYNLSAAVKKIDPTDYGLSSWSEGMKEHESFQTAASETGGAEVARLLIQAGAHPHELDNDVLRELTGAVQIPTQQITTAMFEAQKSPIIGTENPEPAACEFWLEMIRTGVPASSGFTNYGQDSYVIDDLVTWSFDRHGMSTTQLPDGRWVQSAGEHEDFYDPDFFIYNDVVVHDGAGNAQIYTYPHEVFPPTDFHTATLVDDAIILVGSLGYKESRPTGETQVLRLNLKDFSITPIKTSGESPGWISRHQARLDGDRIVIWGGNVWDGVDYTAFEGSYALFLATGVWERTDRE